MSVVWVSAYVCVCVCVCENNRTNQDTISTLVDSSNITIVAVAHRRSSEVPGGRREVATERDSWRPGNTMQALSNNITTPAHNKSSIQHQCDHSLLANKFILVVLVPVAFILLPSSLTMPSFQLLFVHPSSSLIPFFPLLQYRTSFHHWYMG
jgi:hypothetical protein